MLKNKINNNNNKLLLIFLLIKKVHMIRITIKIS